ncbi:MAG: carboxymuconolactone decarboxylase family protein [Hymenobacter sp.]
MIPRAGGWCCSRPAELSAEQRGVYDQLLATEVPWAEQSGFEAQTEAHELIGPFNAMLRSPEIATAMLGLTSALGQHSALGAPVRQVVILTVGAAWQADYELYAHAAVARKAGLAEEAIRALAAGQPPTGLGPEEVLAHEFTRQLVATHRD